MTTEPAAPEAAHVTLLAPEARHKIFFYIGALTLLLPFADPNGGLMDISISFFLKNKLHLAATDLARFRLVAAIPLYLSGLFGLARDRWNFFGMKDRGFFAVFGVLGAALYLIFAFIPVSSATLLAALLLLTSCFLFIAGAQNGLASTLGQQHAMSGRISALWNALAALPGVAAFLIGGFFSDMLEGEKAEHAARALFLAGAALMACIALFSLLKPRQVFDNIAAERPEHRPLIDDLRRLLRHKPIYPALAIWLFWNFAPGAQTPLQYYLQNHLHAPDRVWGEFLAIFAASFVPPFLLYAWLCRRFVLRTLLIWGTVVAVPQMVPLLFVHSAEGALIAAAPIGFMGGVSSAAYIDLLIRSCPPGLQGTTLMLSGGLFYIASRFGDVLGTSVYEAYGGFAICVAMITFVYALILPLILLVPKNLIAYADGEIPHT